MPPRAERRRTGRGHGRSHASVVRQRPFRGIGSAPPSWRFTHPSFDPLAAFRANHRRRRNRGGPMEELLCRVFALVDANQWGRLDEVLAPDCIDHMAGMTATGIDAFVARVQPFYAMAPGLRHEVYDVIPLNDEF